MSAFPNDADVSGWLAPPPWFDLAGPPSVRPSAPSGDQLGDDMSILDRWRTALVARDDDEVDRLVRVSRGERARLEAMTFDHDVLGTQHRSEQHDWSGGYGP